MLRSQYELWEKRKDTWSPMKPEFARDSLLWMMEEIGEVIAIIKKRGENEIEKIKRNIHGRIRLLPKITTTHNFEIML
jgi:hypothetical protein